jgi:hypothetical protein
MASNGQNNSLIKDLFLNKVIVEFLNMAVKSRMVIHADNLYLFNMPYYQCYANQHIYAVSTFSIALKSVLLRIEKAIIFPHSCLCIFHTETKNKLIYVPWRANHFVGLFMTRSRV